MKRRNNAMLRLMMAVTDNNSVRNNNHGSASCPPPLNIRKWRKHPNNLGRWHIHIAPMRWLGGHTEPTCHENGMAKESGRYHIQKSNKYCKLDRRNLNCCDRLAWDPIAIKRCTSNSISDVSPYTFVSGLYTSNHTSDCPRCTGECIHIEIACDYVACVEGGCTHTEDDHNRSP